MNLKKYIERLCLAVFLLFIFQAIPVFPSDLPPEIKTGKDLTDLSLEELADVDVVVAASRYKQRTNHAPTGITIITADDIRKFGYRTLADILKGVRGFYVSYDRNYHYLGMRGFSFPGDYGTRFIFMIDGHRINDAIYQQSYIGTEFPLDIDLIEKIEIVRGPSSSLYGSSALFGIVNIITKKGKVFDGAEVTTETASNETYKTRLTFGKAFEGGRSFVTSGSFYSSRGQNLFYEEFNNPESNYGFNDHDSDGYGQFFASMSSDDFTVHTIFSRREKELPTGSYGTVFNSSDNRTIDERNYVDFNWNRRIYEDIELNYRLYFDYYAYRGYYAYEGETPDNDIIQNDRAEAQWWGGEITAAKRFFDNHRIMLGAEYQDVFDLHQANYDLITNLDDKRYLQNWALFAQDDFAIRSNLFFNAGIRYDKYETFGGTVSPRVALIFALLKETTVKLFYGQGFRAPNPYELFYDDGGILQNSNPNLEPETSHTYAVTVEHKLANGWQFTATGFYYRIDDLISLWENPIDGFIQFRNLESAESNGVDFEVTKKWQSGIQSSASYAYQETEDETTGQRLPNSPKHLAKINLLYPLIAETVFAGIECEYTGNRMTLSGSLADDYVVTNLTLLAGKITDDWELSASVYNLFNVSYYDIGSEEHIQDVIEQDGRNFRLKLTYKF